MNNAIAFTQPDTSRVLKTRDTLDARRVRRVSSPCMLVLHGPDPFTSRKRLTQDDRPKSMSSSRICTTRLAVPVFRAMTGHSPRRQAFKNTAMSLRADLRALSNALDCTDGDETSRAQTSRARPVSRSTRPFLRYHPDCMEGQPMHRKSTDALHDSTACPVVRTCAVEQSQRKRTLKVMIQ